MSALDDLAARDLLHRASGARESAYAPYSGFAVGAAVLFDDGEIVSGANVENASFSATICAERVALTTGIVSGHHRVRAIAVVTSQRVTPPCGVCLQVISEFADADTAIVMDDGGAPVIQLFSQLLGSPFQPASGVLRRQS